MFENIKDIILTLKGLAIYTLISLFFTSYFYFFKKKIFFGGWPGALLVGLLGAFIGGFVLDYLFYDISLIILEFLSRGAGVNILAAAIGTCFFLFIMSKLSQGRNRSD